MSWVLARRYRRFVAARRGIAAVEFAIVLPVLVLLFLASVDGGRAIATYMKVRAATYTLDAITNQYTTIQSTDMASIVGAAAVVLAPYASSPAAVTVSQITVNSSSNATVSWSYSLNGTALTQGATVAVPSGFSSCNSYPCFLIYGQVSYTYTPLFGYFTPSALNLSDNLYVTPRSSSCILYLPGNVSSCPTSSSSSGSGSGSSGSSGSGSSGSGSSGSGSSGSGSSGSGSSGSGSSGSGSSGSGSSGSGSSGSGSGGSGSGGGGSGGSGSGGGLLCILFGFGC
jgi:Flp pilus assembly protein TadG